MSDFEWSALVLAGGQGSRMQTAEPKPLVRVGGRPLVEHNVLRAWRAGAREVFVAVHHRADEIISELSQSLAHTVDLRFLTESEPLGTIGSLGHLEGAAPTVLSANGDLLSAIDLAALVKKFSELGADGLIATHAEHHQLLLGEVTSNAENELLDYREKPTKQYRISSGTNVFGPRMIEIVDGHSAMGVPDLIQRALEARLSLHVFPQDHAWIDVNDVSDLARAEALYREESAQFQTDDTP